MRTIETAHDQVDLSLTEQTSLARGAWPATLDRRASAVECRAAQAGLEVLGVGVAPLFSETRLLVGADTTWVVTPVNDDPTLRRGRLPVPAEQRQRLQALVDAGCDFPVIYSAHEVDPQRLSLSDAAAAAGSTAIDSARTANLVGPAPATPAAVARSTRLGDWTEAVGRVARIALVVAGSTAALPLAVVAAAGAGAGLDPVLFGVVTRSGRTAPGEPGAWFVIAQWTW